MRILWLTLFALVLTALAFAPSLTQREEPFDEELVILSPHWDGIRSEFGRAFAEHYFKKNGRRIRTVWLDYGSSSEVTKYVIERYKQVGPAAGIGADVFFGGGMDNLPTMANANCYEPFVLPPELSEIPASVNGLPLRDSQNRFHASCLSSFGFVYNKEVVKRAFLSKPESWYDLGRAEYRGWISSGDPSLSGSVHQAFEIELQADGWERGFGVLTRMLSNVRAFNEGGPSVPRDVSLGQAAAGACIDFYATAPVRRQGAEHLEYVVPKGTGVFTPDGIALMRGAPNRRAAVEFILFVMSEPGQKLWYLAQDAEGKNGAPKAFDLERLPVLPSIYNHAWPTHTVLNPFKTKTDFIYDSKKASARWSLLNQLMRAVWVDAHEELWDARGEVIRKQRHSGGTDREWDKPPMSEDDFLALAKTKLTPDQINKLKNEWTSWARARYVQIATQAEWDRSER